VKVMLGWLHGRRLAGLLAHPNPRPAGQRAAAGAAFSARRTLSVMSMRGEA
jgi:hypothetical protein